MKFIVKANATTANVGPGFDCVGLALDLKNEILVSDEGTERLTIRAGEGVPTDENNLIYRAMDEVFKAVGSRPESLTIEQTDRIPMTSGLGSSAACIVLGVSAANALSGGKLTERELIDVATRLDGHPDNVLPCLVGGAAAAVMNKDGGVEQYVRFGVDERLFAVALTPDFPLSTAASRKALPCSYPRADVVYSLSRAVVCFAALATGEYDKLACLDDKLHQPYRSPLIPGYGEAVAALRGGGATCAFLSGAGPTVLGIFEEKNGLNRGNVEVNAPRGWVKRVLDFDDAGVVIKGV